MAVAVSGQCPPPREHLRDVAAAATRTGCRIRSAAVARESHSRTVDRLCRRRRHRLVCEPHTQRPSRTLTVSTNSERLPPAPVLDPYHPPVHTTAAATTPVTAECSAPNHRVCGQR